jgi:hypothetical protein
VKRLFDAISSAVLTLVSVRSLVGLACLAGLVSCGAGGGGTPTSTVPPATALPEVGQLSLVLGGLGGPGNVDGVGNQARFNQPFGVVSDAAGNLLVSDQGNATIRKISPSGDVTTVAGKAGEVGQTDGPGNLARFTSPNAVTLDAQGNLWVVDADRIRKVTPAGAVSTVAVSSALSSWQSIAIDPNGQIYGVTRSVRNCFSPSLPCTIVETVGKMVVASDKSVSFEAIPGLEIDVDDPNGTRSAQLLSVANDNTNVVIARFVRQDSAGIFDFFQLNTQGVFERINLPESARRIDNAMCTPCGQFVERWRLSLAFSGDDTFRVLFLSGVFSG